MTAEKHRRNRSDRIVANLALVTALAGLALLCCQLLVGGAARAAGPYTVNSLGDAPDANTGDGACDIDLGTPGDQCTLRAAIEQSNASTGADVIDISATGVITLTSNLPAVEEDLTLNGPGAGSLAVHGAYSYTHFHISRTVVAQISDLSLVNGLANYSEDGGPCGGAIHSDGSLTLNDIRITGCSASEGGAICSAWQSSLVINGGQIGAQGEPNIAGGFGGGVYLEGATGGFAISGTLITNNTADSGGGVFSYGSPGVIQHSTIYSNSASDLGGGVFNYFDWLLRPVGWRGTLAQNGILVSGMTVDNCVVEGNVASAGGGIANSGMMTLTRSVVYSNIVTDVGGGILSGFSIVAKQSNVEGWEGIRARPEGILAPDLVIAIRMVLDRSTVLGNGASAGGGIFNTHWMTMTNSSVCSNTASGNGGGVLNDSGPFRVVNSTISSNRADLHGGGLREEASLTTYLDHVTVVDNVADADDNGSGDGGGVSADRGTINASHTIIARNTDQTGARDCYTSTGGLVASHGYNLVEYPGNCPITATGDITSATALVGPLQDNGGPALPGGFALWTHALLAGSPAIDAGDSSFASPPLFDQRGSGYARVVNGRVDIGAYEAWLPVQLPLVLRSY